MPTLERNLRWYIAVRVVAVTSVLLPFFLVVLARPDSFPAEAAHYVRLLAGTTFAATLIYIGLLRLLRRHLVANAYIQFTGDLLLITVMVYYLGGVASPFSLLYLVIIAVASTLLRRSTGVTVASCAFLLYASLALALSNGWLAPMDPVSEVVSGWRVAYNLAIHFFGFYAMALLTSFLAHNVTRAERELEVKSEHLADLQVVHRDVIQSISSGLITTDLEGTITSINQAGLAILRQADERLIGAPVTRSGLLSDRQWAEMSAASGQQGRLRVEVQVPYDRDSVYIGFSVSRLNDAFGAHRGYIVIFQDLTGWRRMQEELRLKDRMAAVGELAAGLAHEIGNPLAAISGSVQMLSSAPGDASQRRLIDILLKESQRLDRTIKGFLRFARPRDRASVAFDVARLLSENMELLRNSEEVSARHRLELDLEPSSAWLVADPDQVSQIFWNLARNALRAMPDGGTCRLAGRLDGDTYRLEVADTGRGMSEAQRANLFHPFQSFFDGGTGIGMAIVYRIVEEHGGRLRVTSSPSGGTTITVELPAAGPGAHPAAALTAAVSADAGG